MGLRRLVALRRRRWAEGSSKPKFPPEAPALRGGPLPKLTKQSPRRTPKPKKQFARSFHAFCFSPRLCLSHGKNTAPPRVFRFGRSLLIYINDGWGNRLRASEGLRSELGRSSRRQTEGGSQMSLWLIPMIYAAASFLGGITLPRLEQAYFPYGSGISVASAQAFFTAVASGMIALTGIVFTVGLVMVQFSAIAYSPRTRSPFGSRPEAVSFAGCVHRHVYLLSFRSAPCRSQWVRGRAADLRRRGRWIAFAQHAAVFRADEGPNRPPDHLCASRHRRQGPRGRTRDVSAPR